LKHLSQSDCIFAALVDPTKLTSRSDSTIWILVGDKQNQQLWQLLQLQDLSAELSSLVQSWCNQAHLRLAPDGEHEGKQQELVSKEK